MTVVDAVILAVAVALGGGSVIFIVKASAKWVWKAAVNDLLDRLDGRIETHIKPLSDDIAAVKAELSFNGGSTVKDQVKRLADNILTPERDS